MNFTCFSISPIELAHPGIAIATSRAGGVGVLDAEFCRPEQLDCALNNWVHFLASVNPQAEVGLRLHISQLTSHATLLKALQGRSHWLIVSGWKGHSLTALPAEPLRQLVLEITQIEQVRHLKTQDLCVQGCIARGHETGGWVGEDSALILTQRLLNSELSLPIYVQGGIGLHTAAACRAVGAAGVVLDDQLWLMPESPFPRDWQLPLQQLSGQETKVMGEQWGAPCRVLSRPGFQAVGALQQICDRIEASGSTLAAQTWRQQAPALLGWDSPDTHAWPMGQAIGLAAQYRDRYKSTGRAIQALLKASAAHLQTAAQLGPLGPHSALAQSHKTQYPIVQGPMTRVSDTAAFAQAVAQGGGLPMLALALMPGTQVRTLLQQTQALLGTQSWGIGILGFVPQALREEQLTAVLEVKPPFALIAGGRPDQASRLEAQGIATYIHVPTPNLLKLFLEQGAKRFVFEGRECGGHVGPLSSFMLWESTIETLLREVPAASAPDIHVLFAGGIHDAKSAAMVSAMAAPLAQRGMKIGVLMGTAYLFTEEAVACGAIVKEFQEISVACRQTINLETGPGHASRCAVTPFAQEFYQTRQQMMAANATPEEIKNALEDLTLGRLRVATKGLIRQDQEIVSVATQGQRAQGMYMIGQVATLRNSVMNIATLHQEVSQESTELLVRNAQAFGPQPPEIQPSPADIAIIGIGTLLPQAQYPEVFWQNLLNQVSAIAEIPASRWDWRFYYDRDRTARDKVYSKWGGFLDDVAFDPFKFGIPPKSLKSIEPLQLLTLEVVRRALVDAGYESGEFDREHTSVILGAGGGIADLGQQYAVRSEIPRFVDSPTAQMWDRLPEWTEESFPGLLLNVAAGRVANRFDLGGSNFTVDAACASSLAAINLAVKELESGRSNVAIAGGIDTVQSPFAYLCFSKTQALSAQGQARPFDEDADGIVISEGLAIVVLKRLADAQRDGDRIYAVIKAVEGSSDGKALGMTAPLPAGQRRAVNRAYQKAGFSPRTLGLYEAHGTGTVAGDRAELETITSTLVAAQAASNACAIGSVKSLIGHTKCTAGVAGLVKAALALYHQVLPPHAGVEKPLSAIAEPTSPVYLLKQPRPWFDSPNYPRRAGVSAFGFGGTNFHALLEAAPSGIPPQALGAEAWPCELLVFQGTKEAIAQEIQQILSALAAGAEPRLQDLAYTCAKRVEDKAATPLSTNTLNLSIVAPDLEQLRSALTLVLNHWQNPADSALPAHIQLRPASLNAPTLAFLFPGQGSQYPDMLREVSLYFREMRQAVELADIQLQDQLSQPLSQYIYPPSAYSPEQEQQHKQQLTDTCIAQPAIGAVEMGLMNLVRRLGLEPAMICGHSYGEYAALHCAGVLSPEDFIRLSAARGRVMAAACEASEGAMAAVQTTREELQTCLNGVEGVVIANHNAPRQSVISGEKQRVGQVVDNLNTAGILARMLPVAGAFHSALVASAQTALTAAIAEATLHPPQIPVYANATAQPYLSDAQSIGDQLAEHLIQPVNFVGQINAMYDSGARVFVELGPKSILTNLVNSILTGKEYVAVAIDGQRGGELRGLLMALGTLMTVGTKLKLTALFADRNVRLLELSRLAELTQKPPLSPNTWLLQGGSIRTPTEAVGHPGKLPPLTLATATENPATEPPRPQLASPVPTPSPVFTRRTQSMVVPHSSPEMRMTNGHMPPPVTADVALSAYLSYQETMRQFLSVQEQVMKQFLGGSPSRFPKGREPLSLLQVSNGNGNGHHLSNGDSYTPSIAPPPEMAIAPPVREIPTAIAPPVREIPTAIANSPSPKVTSLDLPDRASLTRLLVQLVSDRTGYPTEMLGLDQDIEAELGIDSIKRVEILGALQKQLPNAIATRLQAQMESFTRVKSLNRTLDQLLELSATGEDQCLGKSLAGVESVPRYRIQAQTQPLPPGQLASPQGLFIITEDTLGVAPLVAAILEQRGAQTTIFSRAVLQSPTQLRQQVPERFGNGTVSGIIHLAALSAPPMPKTLAEWHQSTQADVKSLFHLLQSCGTDSSNRPRHVLAASLLGGHFGREEGDGGLASGGGNSGLLKTLAAEWLGIQAKAIDFDPRLSAAEIAQAIVQELLTAEERVEVGYPGGKRTVFQTVLAPFSTHSQPLIPTADWVVLLTGGARGITAEVAKGFLVPGMKLIIVGRSPEPGSESPATLGIEEIAQLRQILLEQARQAGESPTPVQIEAKLQQVLRDRTIRQNLQVFRQYAQVEYHAVDVTQEEAFGGLIQGIYRQYGRLDAAIHGAGIIEDKLIADKHLDSFERVFNTKADSAFLLSRYLQPESLKLLVFFGSVAGRYGNRGQGDYAAANEVVNRLAWQLDRRWPATRVVTLNWGPWDTTGMASESVKRQFRERGIVPISLAAGCQFFLEELRAGRKGDVEIIAGEGPWFAEEETPISHPFVLFQSQPQLQPNNTVILEHTFTLESDRYLVDHQLDGKPVLPATAAIEWFAEMVQAAWPEWIVSNICNLKVLRGLVLHSEVGQRVRFQAKASSHADSESLQVAVELLEVPTQRPFYQASVLLQPALREPPTESGFSLSSGTPLDPQIAYRDYLFHGSCLQLIKAIDRITPEGIEAWVTPSSPLVWKSSNSHWLFDPGLLDTAPQLAIVWARVLHNTTPLPSRFGAVVRYGSSPFPEKLKISLRIKEYQPHSLLYDADFSDTNGYVRLQLRDVEGTCNPQLNRLASSSLKSIF